jgi:Fe2+ transport system protein FeoA
MKLKIDFNQAILPLRLKTHDFYFPLLSNSHATARARRVKQSKMASLSDNFIDVLANGERATENGRGTTTLDALPYGVEARVVSVEGEGAVARRLMEMGVVPGAPVCVIKAAPLGDPIEVRVRGYHLALRRAEAQTILVVTSDK